MGVTGLWTVVQPCARPIKIETLNKKRLAVDASIWIYQFLKAVRDKEGNALRNSHVVGFFRRICKLLFVGILPVFVFDGGAPILKRQTINNRKRRREGRKEDATRTAGKLLALQMQRAAEDEDERRKREAAGRSAAARQEEAVPDADKLVYVDEIAMTQQERAQNRKFRRKDQYHLPDLDASLAEMGAPNDPRIMSLEELEAYARQFDTGEDINVYDFSKIDFDSPFFTSLPASDRYNILNAARLRSRLRMGYSKEQLDTMFPNRMDFSRFQIERVAERNELTQRLMNINGMNDDSMWGVNGTGRVAGEKGREYVLVRNEGVEGGWALGVVTGKDEGQKDKPIDLDAPSSPVAGDEDEESEEDFEDVPIEGLNRLPKPGSSAFADSQQQELRRQRRAVYASRRGRRTGRPARRKQAVDTTQQEDPDSLFVADEMEEDQDEAMDQEHEDRAERTDEEELSRAIAMSLQQEAEDGTGDVEPDMPDDDFVDVFQQRRVDNVPAFKESRAKGGRAIASIVNARANKAPTSSLFQADSESDGEEAEATKEPQSSNHAKPSDIMRPSKDHERASKVQAAVSQASAAKPRSANPLPFERLDLGSSLFGKKKLDQFEQNSSGGFERSAEKKDEAQPLPPWFSGDLDTGLDAQKRIERQDREEAKRFRDEQSFEFAEPSVLRRQGSKEIIDLDAPATQERPKEVLVIDDDRPDVSQDSSDRTADGTSLQPQKAESEPRTMGDIADELKTSPATVTAIPDTPMPPVIRDVPEPEMDDTSINSTEPTVNERANGVMQSAPARQASSPIAVGAMDNQVGARGIESSTTRNASPTRSESPVFEDVEIPDQPEGNQSRIQEVAIQTNGAPPSTDHVSGVADQNARITEVATGDDEDYGMVTDSEDEELMRQLEIEAQEHARFASELNSRPQAANIAEYEKELKQLRTQQKKDRRDADEVTQIMITECQQLLRLFGLPYITAPMEAEAQCAELVHLGLVDGIVTDDSDCFLFGGTRVYKNMFNQAKFVECYLLNDFEREFDLTREKLIGVAQLLGSDYTEGLPGVGPVTALEILSEFPDLTIFREWWTDVQEGRRKREDDAPVPFRRKFRKTNATKLFLPAGFPDKRVENAYLHPDVDSDPSPFQWGVPDLDALRAFLMATIGWNQERTDEVLVPVIRDMNRRAEEGTQSNITKFFAGGAGAGAYAPRVRAAETSKRLGGALDRMAARAKRKRVAGDPAGADGADGEDDKDGPAGSGDHTDGDKSATRSAPKRTSRQRRGRAAPSKAADDDEDESLDDGDSDFKVQSKSSKKRKSAKGRTS